MKILQNARNERSKGAKFSRILITLQSKFSEFDNIVIVEGASDVALFNIVYYRKDIFYCSAECGKSEISNFLSVIRDKIVLGERELFAIADADFDHLSGKKYNNIILTDHHDGEMMILNNHNEFLKTFITEHTKTEYFYNLILDEAAKELHQEIISAGYKIGILKYINLINDYNMNFKGYTGNQHFIFNDFNITLDIYSYIDDIIKRSDRVDNKYRDEIILEYEKEIKKEHNYFQIVNGHDYCNILARVYSEQLFLNKKNITKEHVESKLRTFYNYNFFKKTNVYKNIKGKKKQLTANNS